MQTNLRQNLSINALLADGQNFNLIVQVSVSANLYLSEFVQVQMRLSKTALVYKELDSRRPLVVTFSVEEVNSISLIKSSYLKAVKLLSLS